MLLLTSITTTTIYWNLASYCLEIIDDEVALRFEDCRMFFFIQLRQEEKMISFFFIKTLFMVPCLCCKNIKNFFLQFFIIMDDEVQYLFPISSLKLCNPLFPITNCSSRTCQSALDEWLEDNQLLVYEGEHVLILVLVQEPRKLPAIYQYHNTRH